MRVPVYFERARNRPVLDQLLFEMRQLLTRTSVLAENKTVGLGKELFHGDGRSVCILRGFLCRLGCVPDHQTKYHHRSRHTPLASLVMHLCPARKCKLLVIDEGLASIRVQEHGSKPTVVPSPRSNGV